MFTRWVFSRKTLLSSLLWKGEVSLKGSNFETQFERTEDCRLAGREDAGRTGVFSRVT
jgi:hypothetical protein